MVLGSPFQAPPYTGFLTPETADAVHSGVPHRGAPGKIICLWDSVN